MLSGIFMFGATFILFLVDDLQRDITNPFDMAKQYNYVWWPEFILYSGLCTIFLLSGHWFIFLLHTPLLGYKIYLMVNSLHLVDPATAASMDNRSLRKKIGFINLIWSVLCFILYLYLLITTAIAQAKSQAGI
uniref:Cornichon n=1 Tax=Arcella intermedia TaxID=1963864 RepID=A0A6B2LQR6_9EUKA